METKKHISKFQDGRTVDEILSRAISGGAIDQALQRKVSTNLLDNWYFGNPVNQRGQTEYTAAGFTIDRWRCYTVGASISVTETGLSIKQASASAGYAQLLQRIESAVWNEIYGNNRTVTVSILLANGSLKTKTGKISGFGNLLIKGSSYVRFNVDYKAVDLIILGDTCPDIVAVKLELGDTQTLAHQDADGNWVLNEIPDYGQELAKCQRYYRKSWTGDISSNGAVPFIRSTSGNSQPAVFWENPMRATPTITIYSLTGTKNAITNWSSDTEVTGAHGNYYKSRYGFALNELGGTTAGYAYGFHYEASADL